MISLPLPVLAALLSLVIAPLMLRLDLGRRSAAVYFALLFAGFALQSLLVGLRFGYGIEDFITFQRVLPLSVGPLLYLGFLSLALPAKDLHRQASWHLGAALLLALVLGLFANIYRDFDLAISLSYLIYIALLIRLSRRGPDHLIFARLDIARPAQRWMLLGAGLLLILLILDTAIALNFVFARGNHATAMVSLGSLMLIGLLLLILTRMPSILAPEQSAPAPASESPARNEADLEQRAREMLLKSQIYLDPDLSLQRIARRLSVPERSLSTAINQSQGMNMSQYVNGFRLGHAARLLRDTNDSVSQVMSQSGFLTRSNFYREFQRVYQQTPAQYRDEAAAKTKG
ncbi:helix-turn-helix transcriptional regulator [Sulfitobacter mediterraneus]|uniref:helix-turn-helix domain-containing protein n=1 Tax=Sulfitobacter mediterraneus TaxID=83219 RepID=UPI001934AD6A|nr:AraC family transcriptional regulator [Sulfitobacter mediterraneus]MBM1633786.1 helix-turn-helix transcriptional regulator [Sulfitobacter mediterraneus]MBM1641699.1 helix-turn-helix transcriptional regulator [Sulfitobacter mediterraneus]MBM1645650.1 helix-turn-helix transcriptional regulator [Sulfitobacter mediterraneus]MBM1649818.1 helix-turn-helix transcriptional regulator [Sulfitobacter mediterraneus]MBM1653719.1 helix-turn-helix transcriptional regulator [Sulfitobacter mediterraneus]